MRAFILVFFPIYFFYSTLAKWATDGDLMAIVAFNMLSTLTVHVLIMAVPGLELATVYFEAIMIIAMYPNHSWDLNKPTNGQKHKPCSLL